MSAHDQDRNTTQRGQGSGGQSHDGGQDWRNQPSGPNTQPPHQTRALNPDLDQDLNQTGRADQNPSQNPGQSLSPYQQGRQAFDRPISSGGPPVFGAQAGYGSQELRGQANGAYCDGSMQSGYGQQDDPRQSYGPDRQGSDGQGRGDSFGGTWGSPDPARAWGSSQQPALTDGWGGQRPSPRHHDPHYHAWRERQNRQFDEDWEAFNRERQTTFDEEFETWRKSRAAKASSGVGETQTALGSASSAPDAVSIKDK